MDESAGNTGNEQSIVDLQFNGVVELLLAVVQHVVQTLGLGHGTRETVKNETASR